MALLRDDGSEMGPCLSRWITESIRLNDTSHFCTFSLRLTLAPDHHDVSSSTLLRLSWS